MKRSKHTHDSSEDDQSDSDSKVEKKMKKKHKKHSKSHHRKKFKKEESDSSSSDSEDDSNIVMQKKKTKHRSSSSSSSDGEQEERKHHKKKKKLKHDCNNSDNIETKIKVEPDVEIKHRHHHKHHHHRHEEQAHQSDRHGHSSRHSDKEPQRSKHSNNLGSRDRHRDDGSNSRFQDSDDRRNNRSHDSDSITGRGSRWPHDKAEHSSSQRRDKGPKKPFCDESEEYEWGKKGGNSEDNKDNVQQPKQKPDFGLSGKLTEDTNMFNGVVIKYSEPPDARKPKRRWRLYPFKEDAQLPVLHIHRQSAFLMGRDRKVVDIPVDHPSCSKQHAALQYRLTDYTREDGSKGKRIRLYIIDLESANGTFVNNQKIEAKRYVELLEKDVIKFGFSSREYVLLHEHSKDSDHDDDVQD